MSASHHPSETLLAAYAAGSLSQEFSVVVATHLALCPSCRHDVETLEAVGGVLMDDLPTTGMSAGALDAVLARLNDAPLILDKPKAEVFPGLMGVPQPLRGHLAELGNSLDNLPWRRMGPGVHQVRLPDARKELPIRMLRIEGGRAVPSHGHNGNELTLVLEGGFSDETGTFIRGDLEEADPGLFHQPAAHKGEDCICVAVTDAPLKLSGIARLLQPLIRI